MTLAVVATLTLAANAIHMQAPNAAPQTHHKPDDPPRACRDARNAIVWYRARYNEHRAVMGASSAPKLERHMGCRRVRARARYWIGAARANRAAAERWIAREYADPPEPYLSITRCETGGINGGRPLWTHYNSRYAGAYGFTHQTWDHFKYPGYPSPASRATPRQQTRVAMRLVTLYGWSPWPTCSIRLGLR